MDMTLYVRALFALIAVLGLIALAAYAARRAPQWRQLAFGGGAALPPKRLGVVERMVLDARRQVVILRDGGREHVILLGLSGEFVLETRKAEPAPLRIVDPGPQT